MKSDRRSAALQSELTALVRQKFFCALRLSVALGILCLGLCVTANAQLTILYSFGAATPNDTNYPEGGLVQAPTGDLFGSGSVGGPVQKNGGTYSTFRCTTSGVENLISVFGKTTPITSALLPYAGGLVGTGVPGTAKSGWGALLYLKRDSKTGAWQKTVWHEFGTATYDGKAPQAPVILGSDGYLYGTTEFGGRFGSGTIYKFDPKNHDYKIVHSFDPKTEGTFPTSALLLAKDGNYYGSTGVGETLSDGGTIFKMIPDGTVSTVYAFPSGSSIENAPLIQAKDGNFYGTIYGTGSGSSGVFKMTSNYVVSILCTFGPPPSGTVVQGPNGNLYGMTEVGGSAGRGVIFEITTDGSAFTVLHNFADGSIPNDGSDPGGTLILGTDNNLYGITLLGGSLNYGTVFKYSP